MTAPRRRESRRSRAARVVAVAGLIVGFTGGYVIAGDDIPFERARRDTRSPWAQLNGALNALAEATRVPASDQWVDTPVFIRRDEPGFAELQSVISRFVSSPRPEDWTVVAAVERGMVSDFDEGYRAADVYFGVVTEQGPGSHDDGQLHILGRTDVLQTWVWQYRSSRHTSLGLVILLLALVVQTWVASVPPK